MEEKSGEKISFERLEALIDEAFEDFTPEFQTKRSPTLLKLGWLAERLRKAERIKAQVAAGSYHVDSESVARKMLNLDLAESEE
jgi:hypothetical protein